MPSNTIRKRLMNKIIIWIDDIRDPKNYIKFGSNEQYDIIWCKSYNEFVVALNDINEPYLICFDHDLGDINNPNGEKTGYDCAKYLVDFCLDNDIKLPNFHSQSDNGPGRENILKLLENYKKFESET